MTSSPLKPASDVPKDPTICFTTDCHVDGDDCSLLFSTVLSHFGLHPWEFRLPFPGKASCDRVELPNLRCMLDVFLCFHNLPNSDMDYGIFNVRTDVNACDRTRGCTDTVRESAMKVVSGRKIPCCTGEWNLRADPILRHIPTCK